MEGGFGNGFAVHSPSSSPENEGKVMDYKPLMVTDTMIEEEIRLEGERAKEEALEMEKLQKEAPTLRASMFTKLDELLSQTQLYSEFLLEKMDDIALHGIQNGALKQPNGKKEMSNKRKTQGGRGQGSKRLKECSEVVLPKHEEKEVKLEDSHGMTEEEKNWKAQMELAPLLTGGALKSYQIKGVKWMISLWQNGLNGILADQMGLGKTIQTIGFLAHLKGMGMHGPFLICAPLSTLSNWVTEVKRWSPSMNVLLYHGSKDERMDLRRKNMPSSITSTFPVVVTSFEIVIRDRKFLSHYKWKYIVVDEGHRLKNFDCKLLRELRQIPVANTLLLTGTPLQNNLAELWSLLNFILPDIFTSLHEFQSWFDLSARHNNGMNQEEIEEKKRLQVISKLHLILRPFLLRRLKGEVEKSLPGKKEIILYASMTEQQKQFHEHLINKTLTEYFEEKSSNPGAMTKSRLNNIVMQLRKNCNHPDLLSSQFDEDVNWPPVETLLNQCGKLKLLDRLLSHFKQRGHKVLVFSQMTRMLDLLEYYLQEQGLEPCRIDGSVKQIDRQEQIQEFNSDGKRFIFLLSTRAGGLGINLTSADTVIIYDSDWNPHVDMQAMDRCHRIGQTRPVHVYRLATAHSVECRMLKVASDKLKLEHLVIERGQFRQERDHPKITLEESDLLSILKHERDEEEEFVQSAEISDENLLKVIERYDLVVDGLETSKVYQPPPPLRGPGWEVVSQRTAGANLLSSIEGYSNFSPAVKQE